MQYGTPFLASVQHSLRPHLACMVTAVPMELQTAMLEPLPSGVPAHMYSPGTQSICMVVSACRSWRAVGAARVVATNIRELARMQSFILESSEAKFRRKGTTCVRLCKGFRFPNVS